jgi:hypothetical protein
LWCENATNATEIFSPGGLIRSGEATKVSDRQGFSFRDPRPIQNATFLKWLHFQQHKRQLLEVGVEVLPEKKNLSSGVDVKVC